MKKRFPMSKTLNKNETYKTNEQRSSLIEEEKITNLFSPEKDKFINNTESEIVRKGKTKLSSFLSTKKTSMKNSQGSIFVDLFFLNEKYLNVYKIETKLNPASDNCPSYTTNEFDTYDDILKVVETFKTNTENKIKVLHLKDSKEKHYVLKRCWIQMNENNENELDEVSFFLTQKYTEYGLVKLYNSCPHSAKPAGFHIIYLTDQKLLVTEMLTLYEGKPLCNCFPVKESSIVLEYFRQILHSVNFLEAYKIEHNDIKPENFLLDLVEGLALIKLIDFDIGINQSQDITTKKNMGCKGFTPGYVAPEIYNILNSNKNEEEKNRELKNLDTWKCHAYSIGILILKMIGFIPDVFKLNDKVNEIDNLKTSYENYEKLSKKLEEYQNQQSDILMKNIIYLVRKCLNYNPEPRAKAEEVLLLLNQIESNDVISIEYQWQQILSRRVPSRETLKSNLEMYFNENQLLHKNKQQLNDERNLVIQFFRNIFPGFENSNSNLPTRIQELIGQMLKGFESEKMSIDSNVQMLKNLIQKLNKEKSELFERNNTLEEQIYSKTSEINLLKTKCAEYELVLKNSEQLLFDIENNITNQKNKVIQPNLIGKDQLQVHIQKEISKTSTSLKNVCENFSNLEINDLQKNQLGKNQLIPNSYIENKNYENKLEIKYGILIEEKKEINNSNKRLEENETKNMSFNLVKQISLLKERISEYKNFKEDIIGILFNQGIKAQDKTLNEINQIISEKFSQISFQIKSQDLICPICQTHHQNYQKQKNCVIKSGKVEKSVSSIVQFNDKKWNFEGDDIKLNDLILISILIQISTCLEFIHFAYNKNFDSQCMNYLIKVLKVNKSLKGVSLYKEQTISIDQFEEILSISLNNKNLICFYFDKEILTETKAREIAGKYSMEINNWNSKSQ